MKFTCTLLNIKLSKIFQVKFCTNYETFIHIVLNFREIGLSDIPQPTHTYAHLHPHTTPTHTHKHTHTSNTVPVCEGIYLVFHIQFSRYGMKLLSVVVVNIHTNNYSCIVTATRHVWFHVWHLLFKSMLHFYTPKFVYTPAVPRPLFTRSPSTHIGTIMNGTMAHSTAYYSMVQSPSWEANWSAASQETPRISRNPNVHYRTHKRPPPVSILVQPNPVHLHTSHLLEIRSNIRQSTPRSPQWSPSLRFPHQDPIHPLSSPIRATCPTHLILLDFITRTILGEEYKSFSSSLCNLLHFPITSSLLGPNILLNAMFSNTLSFLSSRNVKDQVSHPYTFQCK